MTSPYKAVFLLPPGTEKWLGNDGWEFASTTRLPPTLLQSLANALRLRKVPSCLGMEVFEGDGLKLTATTDKRGIEHIFVQIWARPKEEIERALADDAVEIFAPPA